MINNLWIDFTSTTKFKSKYINDSLMDQDNARTIFLHLELEIDTPPSVMNTVIQLEGFFRPN